MPADESSHPLDNALWHGFMVVDAPTASGSGRARRIDLDGLTAAALADHSDAAYADLAQLFVPGEQTMLFEARPPSALPGFTILHRDTLTQMVAERPAPAMPREAFAGEPAMSGEIVSLNFDDVQEIVRLVELTQPGPFVPRMLELGHFFGIRADGVLVAMAGQRTHPPGYREISTVCTHPDYQRRGYAGRLIAHVMRDIGQEGETPFLHANPSNTSAIHLYEQLGFRKRADVEIIIILRDA